MDGYPPSGPGLASLTGVRSGKRSYYEEFRRSDERLERTVEAMDAISRALVRTVEGPRGLLEEVARTAALHLDAEWVILALTDRALTGSLPRVVVVDSSMTVSTEITGLPEEVAEEVRLIRTGGHAAAPVEATRVRVPMTIEGRQVGGLTALPSEASPVAAGDLSVMGILANLAAVALHTSQEFQASQTLHQQARRQYAEAEAKSRELAQRTRQLNQTQERLTLALQRELLDTERHRIARELHDSVAQVVLSAGMSMELTRGILADGDSDPAALESLGTAKDLCGQAVEQLRRAIYALHLPHHEQVASLPDLLNEVAGHHRPGLGIQVRVVGTEIPIPADASHEIARAVGEALFNVVAHADADRAVIRVRYGPEELMVAVADNGQTRAAELQAHLERSRRVSADGRHRGLVNIETRIHELGGRLAVAQSRLGGPRLEMHIPLPLHERRGVISGLVGGNDEQVEAR